MQPLELNKSWGWFQKSFNKNIPFFTFVDFNFHREYVLDKIYKNTLTIIDCSQDPVPVLEIYNNLWSLGLVSRVVLFTSNYDDYTAYSNIFYVPYQLIRSRVFYKKLDITNKRKYKVSCLNRNPNTHKIYTFFKLHQLAAFNEMLISFSNIIPCDDRPLLSMDAHNIRCMPDNVKEKLSKILLYRQDVPNDDIWNWQNLINHNNHPAFSDSYLNIITETSYELVCLSEKTFKPLISGQLIAFSSAPCSLAAIKKIGFETFDETINPQYDTVLDMYARIDLMIHEIDNLYHNIEDLYHENKEKIEFNQNHCLSDQLENNFLKPLIDIGVII